MAGRPSIEGTQARAVTYVRETFDYRFKDAVLAVFLAGCAPGQLPPPGRVNETLAQFFPLHCGDKKKRDTKRKMIYDWAKDAKRIMNMAATGRGGAVRKSRPLGAATVFDASAEEQIVEWITDLRRDGVPVSAEMLQLKALETAVTVGIDERFTASYRWRLGFLRRHQLSFRSRTHQSQLRLAEAERVAAAFREEVAAKIRELGVGPSDVLNADQTAVFFELLPRKTVNETGERTVWVKCGAKEKDRATVMVMGAMDGTKFPPWIVFKATPSKDPKTQRFNNEFQNGFGRGVWKEVAELQKQHKLVIFGNNAGWWNADIQLSFLKHHFGDRHRFSPPKVLLLDHFSGHWTQEVKDYAAIKNVHLLQIPAGLTWRCQPADVAWMKPIKDRLRRAWVSSLRQQLAAEREEGERFKMVAPNRRVITEWIRIVWDDLSEEIITNGFRACGYSTNDSCVEEDSVVDHGDVIEELRLAGVDCGFVLTDDMDITIANSVENDCETDDVAL